MNLSQGVIYAEFDVWCMVIMIMLTLKTVFLSRQLEHQKLYLLLMAFAMILVGSDFLYEIYAGGVLNCSISLAYVFNIIYFISSIAIAFLWFLYSQAVSNPELFEKKWPRWVAAIPAVILCVGAIFTSQTKWVFYLDESGEYHRGALNIFYMVIPLVYFIGATFIAFLNYLRNKDKHSLGQLKTVAAFALFPIGAVGVQAFMVGFPAICIGASLGMLQVFLNNIAKDREELVIRDVAAVSKNEFFTGMSHEIRTPINAIIGMNTMILRECEDSTIKSYATDVDSSSKLLLALVNDILDISKIEAGELKIVSVEYDLEKLLKDLVSMIAIRVREKEIKLVLNIDEKLPKKMMGDEMRLRQIIVNLLTNAVRATSVGKVTLTMKAEDISRDSVDLYVSVSDTGSGMTTEEVDRLLNPYETVEEHKNRRSEGTGLGMSITKKLLELMDSKLGVYTVQGKGSKFFFNLGQKITDGNQLGIMKVKFPANIIYAQPILNSSDPKKAAAAATKSMDASGAGSAKTVDDSAKTSTATKEAIAKAGATPMADESAKKEKYIPQFKASTARVLSVDDTAINLKVFKALLKPTEMIIDTVESGKEALELVMKNEYDMIFLDIMMPEMDGVETLHAIRDGVNKTTADTPIIALTANALAGAKEEYLAEGFNDYLSKPIAVQLLEEIILRYLPKEKIFKNE